MNKSLTAILIIIFNIHLFAQVEPEGYARGDTSSGNMIYYHDDLNLKFVINRKFTSLGIRNDALERDIYWRANDNNNIGLGFSYKWLGLNLLANFRAINNDDDIYGYTNSLLLLTSIYTKKLGLDGYLMASRGFYLDEPEAWYPNWMTGDKFPLNQDLTVVSAGINALYIFNGDRFSLKSTIILNERQKRSAGSFLAGAYIGLFGFQRDSTSILPFSPDSPDLYGLDITSASYANLGILGGYGHNFIIKEYFFISLLGAIGLDAENSEIMTLRPEYNNYDSESGSAKIIVRFAAGYSGDQFFAAMTGFNDANRLGRSLSYDFGFLRFTFGYRIKDFRFKLKKKA